MDVSQHTMRREVRVLLISQKIPVHPARHWQVKPLTPSMQVAPFRQGLEAHSLISKDKKKKEQSISKMCHIEL